MELFEGLLPSGRAVRVRRMETRDKLAIDDRVETRTKGRGSQSQTMTETALTCLHSYTDPQPFKMRTITICMLCGKEIDGERCETCDRLPKNEADTGVDVRTKSDEVVDVDATLDAVPKGAWRMTSYEELSTKGPNSLLEVFNSIADFSSLVALVTDVSNNGIEKQVQLAKKVRRTSSA